MKYSTYVGIDTHARKNSICAIFPNTGEILRDTLPGDIDLVVEWIKSLSSEGVVRCVYESGPTGFGLARALGAAGIECAVAATSRLAYPNDKRKNDRSDAEFLARQLMAGSIHQVRIPSPREESLCRLSRLRGQTAKDLSRAKQRVASFLLVTGTDYTLTKRRWTQKFRQWAQEHEFPEAADTFAFRELIARVLELECALSRIESEILETIGSDGELSEKMSRLLCMPGIGKVAAFSLICEVNDFHRFKKGSSFAAFVGLVPSERSSGDRVVRGAISKTGNSHLRRILVECAGYFSRGRHRLGPCDDSVPAAVSAKAQKCNDRLFRRRAYLRERGVAPCKAKIAIARELSEWIYHVMVMPV